MKKSKSKKKAVSRWLHQCLRYIMEASIMICVYEHTTCYTGFMQSCTEDPNLVITYATALASIANTMSSKLESQPSSSSIYQKPHMDNINIILVQSLYTPYQKYTRPTAYN